MSQEPDNRYFVRIDESLVGRRAGGSAAEKARELRAADPLGTRVARLLCRKTDERAWQKGANGERVVGWLLGRLPKEWHVFNDIPVGHRGANIDHVVVGPAGVFTVNTKNLTGKVWVGPRTLLHNGYRTYYLPKAAAEARRASRMLSAVLGRSVEVRGVLAILADDWTIKEQPADVYVSGPRRVKHWLLAQPAVLSTREVIEIAGAAAKPATWQDPKPAEAQRCPCGGEIVRRTQRKDGSQFLGCSRFPKCRRTWPAER